MDTILNKKSGVLGISGVSSDFRDIEEASEHGNDRAEMALEVFAYKVAKRIGAYASAMNGVDCIVFTAGLGENSGSTRRLICDYLGYLGHAWIPIRFAGLCRGASSQHFSIASITSGFSIRRMECGGNEVWGQALFKGLAGFGTESPRSL